MGKIFGLHNLDDIPLDRPIIKQRKKTKIINGFIVHKQSWEDKFGNEYEKENSKFKLKTQTSSSPQYSHNDIYQYLNKYLNKSNGQTNPSASFAIQRRDPVEDSMLFFWFLSLMILTFVLGMFVGSIRKSRNYKKTETQINQPLK